MPTDPAFRGAFNRWDDVLASLNALAVENASVADGFARFYNGLRVTLSTAAESDLPTRRLSHSVTANRGRGTLSGGTNR
jgi:hypothetical protein